MTDPATEVRSAAAADLPAVKAIYDEQVATSIATFDLVAPPIAYWQDKLSSTDPGDHLLVATTGEQVLGYAYSSAFRPRPAYAATRETSIYLHADARGRGVGRLLYDGLLERLRADGVRTAVAVVALPNDASEALHRACGFARVGVLHEVGRKLDRWVDTAWWELGLFHGE